MIERQQGDILAADAEALVNTVNCVGIMGRGIALQFRKAFPGNYAEYKLACDRQQLQPGRMLVHDLNRLANPRLIINFPTKRHWKAKSRLADIESGLDALVGEVRARAIRSIAVPPLGCGLGGLRWEDVRPRIERAFAQVAGVRVLLFEPGAAPVAERMARAQERPKLTQGRAALLGLMARYLGGVMDPSVSLLEIHKLLYFMQEAGEPLRLRYQKAPYGPYAENLRHVLNVIEGHYVTGYGDAEDRPDKQIELVSDAATLAQAHLREHPRTLARFERVGDLIAGFESPYGMELLATVHWVATREGARTAAEAVETTHGWNARKRMFSNEHIAIAWAVLDSRGWLPHPTTR